MPVVEENFLNEHGTETLWAKIKNTFALKSHTHDGYVPTSRTILGKTLATDFTLLDMLAETENRYLGINSLSVFSNTGVTPSTSGGDSSVSGSTSNATITIPAITVGNVYKHRVFRYNRSTAYNRTLTIKAPSGGSYIGIWVFQFFRYDSDDSSQQPALASFLSPSHNPSLKTSLTEEALLHIIKENYQGRANYASAKFDNTGVNYPFPSTGVNDWPTHQGKIKVSGGGTIFSCDVPRMYDGDTYVVQYGITGSLWLYRIS